MKLLAVRRLFRILRVVIRYRLDDLLFALPLPFWLRATGAVLPWRWLPRPAQHESRGACLRLALEDLGCGLRGLPQAKAHKACHGHKGHCADGCCFLAHALHSTFSASARAMYLPKSSDRPQASSRSASAFT